MANTDTQNLSTKVDHQLLQRCQSKRCQFHKQHPIPHDHSCLHQQNGESLPAHPAAEGGSAEGGEEVDIGGEERPMDRKMMESCDYLIPNESELKRLVRCFGYSLEDGDAD